MTTIGRYDLVDLVSSNAGEFWYARDDALDRPVAIRVLRDDDPRVPALLGAARAAALVEDRRLLRVLDVMNIPVTDTDPAKVAVVREWATGRTLEQIVEAEGPMPAEQALAIVAEVATAVSAGQDRHVAHGALRPASVLLTDAGELRVRGLAIDAALRNPSTPTSGAGDVEALGCLLYYLTTGRWPGAPDPGLPPAPRRGDQPLPPSQVQASIPRVVDDLVGRSIPAMSRPRGLTMITDPAVFAEQARITPAPVERSRRGRSVAVRILGTLFGAAIVVGVAFVGWQLISAGPPAWTESTEAEDADILTSTALPTQRPTAAESVEIDLVIERGRSFDPLGDDNDDGEPDGRRGRENNRDRALAIDGNQATAWLTDAYSTPDLDGKGGVGYLVNLGAPQNITSITVSLTQPGANVSIKTSDQIIADPDLWTSFGDVRVASDEVFIRAPRPVTGQYVLVWLTRLPVDPERPNSYQVGISDITIRG